MTRKIKTVLSSTVLASLLGAGSLVATPSSVVAADRHDDRGRVEQRDNRHDDRDDHRDFDRHDNDRRDDRRDDHRDNVRVDLSIGRATPQRVWVEPVYQTVTDHVWHPAVTRTECQRVWVPDKYNDIAGWGGQVLHILVQKGHYEDRNVEVVVTPGYYEDACRQVCVTPGHWENCG